ncbi:hypothetical protein Tco_1272156 [Tanacetum coccineum]
MGFRNFIYTEDDDDLAVLPKEPSPGFGIGSPSALVNTKPPKDVEEPEVQPAEFTTDSGESPKAGMFVVHPGSVSTRIKERKCKTRGGSSRPPVKRKLAYGSSSSRVVRAKTSASKDDAPFLSISNDDEDCFEIKDANACHLKISAITPPAWRGYLDNQMDLKLLDLNEHCYARQAMVDNVVKRRAPAMAEFDQNPIVLALREKISSLYAKVKEHKGNLDRMMLESQKWAGYQVTLSALESKVTSLEADKALLEAVEASLHREIEELRQDMRDVVSKVMPYAAIDLVHSDELGRLVGKLVSFANIYEHCKAYEQVATMKEPFDLSKVKGYRSSYQKEHTQVSNDFAIATFPWLDEFVVNKRAREFLQVIARMSGEANIIKARERSREEECEGLRAKCEVAKAKFDQNHAILALREKVSSLSTKVKEHKGNLDRMMLESQKWAGYQVTLSALKSKVTSLEADKARLEAIEASLSREIEELRLVGKLVSSAITYKRYKGCKQVAAMKEPFDLSKVKGYHSSYQKKHTQASNDFSTAMFPWLDEFVADATAPIEALLSKKPSILQKPAPSRTLMPAPSS